MGSSQNLQIVAHDSGSLPNPLIGGVHEGCQFSLVTTARANNTQSLKTARIINCSPQQIRRLDFAHRGHGFREFTAWLSLVTHEHGKDHRPRQHRRHAPAKRSVLWVHGRLPELLRVHFTQTLVALVESLARCIHNTMHGARRRHLFHGVVTDFHGEGTHLLLNSCASFVSC